MNPSSLPFRSGTYQYNWTKPPWTSISNVLAPSSQAIVRRKVSGNLVHTGVHVYTTLKRAIPKTIQIGGRRVWTKYTGQDGHLQTDPQREMQSTHTPSPTPTPDNTSVYTVVTAPTKRKQRRKRMKKPRRYQRRNFARRSRIRPVSYIGMKHPFNKPITSEKRKKTRVMRARLNVAGPTLQNRH